MTRWPSRTVPVLMLFGTFFLSTLTVGAQTLKIETIGVAPFGFTDPAGKPTGMMYEISNRIAQEAGLKFTNQVVPYARTISDLESGTVDMVLRFSNDQLPTIATPLASIVTMPTIILFRPGSAYKSLQDLHGKSVGLLRGGKFDDRFDNDTAIKKTDANDYDQILKMLLADHVEAGIGTTVGLYYSAYTLGIKPEELAPPLVLSNKDFLLHFSKASVNLAAMDAVKAAVEKLKKTGEIKQIINKYMGNFAWNPIGS